MDYTFATVIIAAEDQGKAQADLGAGFFVTALSETGVSPATHYMSSGAFNNSEMDKIVNQVSWHKSIYFGQDWESALVASSLKLIQE